MMNPLYYAEMIGWQRYQNFAYPGEVPPEDSPLNAPKLAVASPETEDQKINVAADQYAKYYQTMQGGDYQYYYDYYCKTYGDKPISLATY